MDQHRVNRRRRRNFPAELKLEIVDCFPLENAVHFLASVPNRLLIRHFAPRVRRILTMIYRIAGGYARSLYAPVNYDGHISLQNGHEYTPEMDIFLRHGAAQCRSFHIWYGTSAGFVGYPANFFDDLIKYYYETMAPAKTVPHLRINLLLENAAPWPAAFVQPAGEMKVEEEEVDNYCKCVRYFLRNKHNPAICFKLLIHFDGGGKCYQQMTRFTMWRVKDVQSREDVQSRAECPIAWWISNLVEDI